MIEPSAWMYPDDLDRFKTSETFAQAYSIEMVSPTQGETVPLYTQRKPLTQKQVDLILAKHELNYVRGKDRDDLLGAIRDIEAAHGIKGEA